MRGEPVKSNVVLPKGKPNAINAINDLFLFLSNGNVIHFHQSEHFSSTICARTSSSSSWGLFKVMFNFPLLDPPEISFFWAECFYFEPVEAIPKYMEMRMVD